MRRGRDVSVLESSITVLGISNKEVVVDEGKIFVLGENGGVMVREEMIYIDFGGAGGNEVPFLDEISDKISSVPSVMRDSTVASLLEIIHFSSIELKVLKKQVRSCSDCRKIAHN